MKNAIHKQDPSARTQNEGPKDELDECAVRFVAAQLPTGSIDTSVACGPDSPRPKDRPGLGDPNTLKLCPKSHSSSKTSSLLIFREFVLDEHFYRLFFLRKKLSP